MVKRYPIVQPSFLGHQVAPGPSPIVQSAARRAMVSRGLRAPTTTRSTHKVVATPSRAFPVVSKQGARCGCTSKATTSDGCRCKADSQTQYGSGFLDTGLASVPMATALPIEPRGTPSVAPPVPAPPVWPWEPIPAQLTVGQPCARWGFVVRTPFKDMTVGDAICLDNAHYTAIDLLEMDCNTALPCTEDEVCYWYKEYFIDHYLHDSDCYLRLLSHFGGNPADALAYLERVAMTHCQGQAKYIRDADNNIVGVNRDLFLPPTQVRYYRCIRPYRPNLWRATLPNRRQPLPLP